VAGQDQAEAAESLDQAARQFRARHVRHAHIQQGEVEFLLACGAQRVFAAIRCRNRIAAAGEALGERGQSDRVVVDHQDAPPVC